MKYVWIEANRDQYSVARMCRQLGVSRTGYCQWRRREPSERSMANAALDAQVAAIHENSKRSYGRPRIVRSLRDCGVPVSHERVRNSLKRQGLRPVYRRPFRITTDSDHNNPSLPTYWLADSMVGKSIRHGSATSPMLKPERAGSIWPALWIWRAAELSAGR